MKKIRDVHDNKEESQNPEEIVIRAFSRCQNYPKERAGVLGLAQGLVAASEKFSIPMEKIVAECVSSSTFCPTDYDLTEVARSLKKQSEFTMGPKPIENCHKCNDWGSYNDNSGQPQWCDCRAAEQLREDQPNWLELCGKLRRKANHLPGLHHAGRTMEILKR